MGVKVKPHKGAWWIFIDHRGQRKAKRVGVGEAGKKAAREAAAQIQARLALGQGAFQSDQAGITLQTYAEGWLEHIKQVRKHTTHADYKKRLDQWILPSLGKLDMRDITREKVRSLVTEQLRRACPPRQCRTTSAV